MVRSISRAVDVNTLRREATAIRRNSLQMVHRARLGHPGGDMSATDILVTLYFTILNVDPLHPTMPDRDRFILSKGHTSASFYATLARAGFFPEADLQTFMQPGSALSGHPHNGVVPGIEASTGPLGHGMPIAVGAALAAKSAAPIGGPSCSLATESCRKAATGSPV